MVLLLLHFRLATYAHAPHLRDRHGQPEPFHATCLQHFAMMPAPETAFEIFETGFDPRSHPIPTDVRFFRREVCQHHPGMLVACFPMHE